MEFGCFERIDDKLGFKEEIQYALAKETNNMSYLKAVGLEPIYTVQKLLSAHLSEVINVCCACRTP